MCIAGSQSWQSEEADFYNWLATTMTGYDKNLGLTIHSRIQVFAVV